MAKDNVVKITKNNKKKGLVLIPFILIAITTIILLFSPIFNIKKVEVKGISKLSENIVISSSKIACGNNILQMNKIRAKENLSDITYIEGVTIRRKWPDTVVIEVTEREPVARVAFFGSEILIDEDAYILEIITKDGNSDLPELGNVEVSSYNTGSLLETNNEETLKTFTDVLKKLKNNDMLKRVAKISVDDGIILYLTDGHVAKLGEKVNLDYKIRYLKEIIIREKNEALIDLSNPEQPILKPLWGALN